MPDESFQGGTSEQQEADASFFWIQDGKIVTDSSGNPIFCPQCPGCDVSVEYERCSGIVNARDQIETDGDFWIVPDSSSLQGGNQDFCMGARFLRDINQTAVIMAKDCDAGGREYLLEQRAGNYTFLIYDGVSTTEIGSVSTPASGISIWDFVFAGYDQTANRLKIAANGAAFTQSATLSSTPGTGTGDMHLGSGCGGSGASGENINDGGIGRLFFYGGKFLSQAEVDAIYAACPLYADLTAGQKTSLSAWWDGDEASGDIIDDHSTHDGTAQGTPEDRTGPCTQTIFVDPTVLSTNSPYPSHILVSSVCYQLVGGSQEPIDTSSITSEHTDCTCT